MRASTLCFFVQLLCQSCRNSLLPETLVTTLQTKGRDGVQDDIQFAADSPEA